MKSIPVVLLCAVMLVVGGCTAITGSGSVATEPRQVTGFETIDLTGVGNVVIEQAGSDALTIEAESNLLPELTSDVSNGILTLGTKPGRTLIPTRAINYRVQIRQLTSVRLSGSGSVSATAISTAALSVEISGSGDVTVGGAAQTQTVAISGSGDYKAAKLDTKAATVDISGSGDATINTTDTLEANISGSGTITYLGSPRVTKDISGSGEVHRG